jgi:lipopolysaccharide transport system ATP-binding protein
LASSLRHGIRDVLGEFRLVEATTRPRLRADEFWALDDVSFELPPGQALGIIGPNGAGKSTLLRVLHGLSKPDAGEVTVIGRVSALMGLGLSFDPLLSGVEAIRVEAALLGLGARGSSELVERVADFAELGDFLDEPIRSYSTGMRMRLGYAIAVQVEPDVLLVDEVLAVGDLDFQYKCFRHIQDFLAKGGSVALVSHNMWMVQALCRDVLVLDHGRTAFSGPTEAGVSVYLDLQSTAVLDEPEEAVVPDSTGPVRIEMVALAGADGSAPVSGEPADVIVEVRCDEPVEVRWGFSLMPATQFVCLTSDSSPFDLPVRLHAGVTRLSARLPMLPFVRGPYYLRVAVLDHGSGRAVASVGWDQAPVLVRLTGDGSLVENLLRVGKVLIDMPATVVSSSA